MTFSDDDDDEDDNSDSGLPEGGAPELENIEQDSGGWLIWACNETLSFTSQEAEYRKSLTEPGFVFYECSLVDPLLHFLFVVELSATLYSHVSHHFASHIPIDCTVLKWANRKVIGCILI